MHGLPVFLLKTYTAYGNLKSSRQTMCPFSDFTFHLKFPWQQHKLHSSEKVL